MKNENEQYPKGYSIMVDVKKSEKFQNIKKNFLNKAQRLMRQAAAPVQATGYSG